jgi:hypothetical protein
MGDRFGHWLGCAVVVDSEQPEMEEVTSMRPVSSSTSVAWHGKLLLVEYIITSINPVEISMVDVGSEEYVEHICIFHSELDQKL